MRIYYRLTPKGQSVVKEKIQEMSEFLKTLRNIIDPEFNIGYE